MRGRGNRVAGREIGDHHHGRVVMGELGWRGQVWVLCQHQRLDKIVRRLMIVVARVLKSDMESDSSRTRGW